MAAAVVFGPAAPSSPRSQLSESSSPQTVSGTSSESPKTATSFVFSTGCRDRGDLSPEAASDDVVPKVEEVDDEDPTAIVAKVELVADEANGEENVPPTNGALVRRPRGRPRKHPPTPPKVTARPPKGRSKTGCITCRRRKKKCDETKPACLHCQKNNVHCEGYPPKDYWKPGKQNKKDRRLSIVERPRDLPRLIPAIETEVDWYFFEHFNINLSRVLSLFTDRQNPFKEILLPMAMSHRGLMHSLLCLSGAHLTMKDPKPDFETRQQHHFSRAIDNLCTEVDANMQKSKDGDEMGIIEDPTVAQTLVLCLKSICAGEVHGEYRPHLDVAKHLVKTQQSRNQEFQNFLVEFFVYHDVSNSITSVDRPSLLMMEDFQLPQFMLQPEAGMFLGVLDGLFGCLSKIRALRDRIRKRQKAGLKPVVDYEILCEAQEIESTLRAWQCEQPVETPRWSASMLYRQCSWLYLYRTIMASKPSETLKNAVDEGLRFLRDLPTDSSTQSIMLMPVFILGCSAFEKEQRPEISQAFATLQAYSNLGNIKYAKMIVERVWEMMDAGNEASWDWETIIKDMGWDFLIT